MSVFDKTLKQPSKALMLLESRMFLEIAAYFRTRSKLREHLPRGDGHPVLIIPGFLAGDRSTGLLRALLGELNYAALRWKLGLNLIFSHQRIEQLQQRVLEINSLHGAKVSLIGWSLGGLLAREVARLQPHSVRLVITLGSPFARSLKANNVHWLYRFISGRCVEDIDPSLIRRMQEPPPVPTTAIYSRSDGIVAWQCCMEQREGPITENVGVRGSHCGLGYNPKVLRIIADRLAQPEGHWLRFEYSGTRRLPYPRLNGKAEVGA
jgi:pimeloyl-ACP methyl ester carboxylesterase